MVFILDYKLIFIKTSSEHIYLDTIGALIADQL